MPMMSQALDFPQPSLVIVAVAQFGIVWRWRCMTFTSILTVWIKRVLILARRSCMFPNVPPVIEPDLSAMYRDDPKMVITWPPPQSKL